jgi:hypothetical protein
MIRLRFVQGSAVESEAIELREGTCMPIIPSHVECVRPSDGKYVGQHIEGGMLARDPGYDGAKPADELFVDLPATPEQTDAFYAYIEASIGEPYDWEAILGFVLPGHFHTKEHAFCSAKMHLGLRIKGCEWYPSQSAVCAPAHCIDPRDFLLMISCIVKIDLDRP